MLYTSHILSSCHYHRCCCYCCLMCYYHQLFLLDFLSLSIDAGLDRNLLSLENLENLVRSYRMRDFSDWEAQLFAPGLCRVGGDDERNFVRFNVKMPIDSVLVQVASYCRRYCYYYSLNTNPIILSTAYGICAPRTITRAKGLRVTWICRRNFWGCPVWIFTIADPHGVVLKLRHVCANILYTYDGKWRMC